MAYTYTLTNESKFQANEFLEGISDIQLKNNGTVECKEIVESIELKEKGSFHLGADNKIYCNEFIEE